MSDSFESASVVSQTALCLGCQTPVRWIFKGSKFVQLCVKGAPMQGNVVSELDLSQFDAEGQQITFDRLYELAREKRGFAQVGCLRGKQQENILLYASCAVAPLLSVMGFFDVVKDCVPEQTAVVLAWFE